jgi:hypothetical protein
VFNRITTYFRNFLPIFCKEVSIFLQNPCRDVFFWLNSYDWTKNYNFSRIVSANVCIYKIYVTSVPRFVMYFFAQRKASSDKSVPPPGPTYTHTIFYTHTFLPLEQIL